MEEGGGQHSSLLKTLARLSMYSYQGGRRDCVIERTVWTGSMLLLQQKCSGSKGMLGEL